MPFKSKRQQRFFFAAEAAGKLPKGTAREWAKHTPDISALPEAVRTDPDDEQTVEQGKVPKEPIVPGMKKKVKQAGALHLLNMTGDPELIRLLAT